MQLRDLIDRCVNDAMMTIYIPGEDDPKAAITGSIDAISFMVSDSIFDYLVDEVDIDDNKLIIRLMEED